MQKRAHRIPPIWSQNFIKKNSAETIIPSFLDYEYGRINIFYRRCKKVCSYFKQEGHWKSNCEFLRSKNKKNSKKTPNSTINQTDDQAIDTSKAIVKPNGQPETDEPSTVDHKPPKPQVAEQQRGTVGMKRPPACSIAMAEARQAEKDNVQTGVTTQKYI
ncbi:hypothetical protein AYI69_g10725 [Smittium culicis]|uniref:Uncharacterized protein n=1 Tax=Smittium culicis TaxID=133412 RepID=A0A1R1X3Y3_9FUNG|nr:hypothetical protein AYI69_g10725 [Smittium culicis]